jgi:hypothetical protein
MTIVESILWRLRHTSGPVRLECHEAELFLEWAKDGQRGNMNVLAAVDSAYVDVEGSARRKQVTQLIFTIEDPAPPATPE